MTIKEVNEMRRNNFEGYEKEKLMEGYVLVNATKNTFANLEKDIKSAMDDAMSVGDQLTLDFGSNTFVSSMVETDDIGFDCSDEDLYSECVKCASAYCKHSTDKTAIKKDYKKGTLHPDIIKHIVINKQQQLKISKHAKKEEN